MSKTAQLQDYENIHISKYDKENSKKSVVGSSRFNGVKEIKEKIRTIMGENGVLELEKPRKLIGWRIFFIKIRTIMTLVILYPTCSEN